MHTERWFNVLVVGGAAIGLAACGGESPEGGGGGSSPSASGGEGTGAAGGTASGTGSASAEAGGGGAAATGGASSAGGNGNTGAGGQTTLVCSENADASDPCGCPCCWANDCANTDESCCAGFCEAGDDGLGCCGQ